MGNSLAFHPPQYPQAFYESVLQSREDLVELTTSEDENIPACYVRCRTARPPRLLLLYSHGNAEDLAEHLDYIDELAREVGADVFSYEYVGYSLSRLQGATPSEAACNRSADAAWRYCTEELRIPANQIVIFGRSIGSGPAVDLAHRASVEGCPHSPLEAAGVILQSPIESGGRAVLGYWASVAAYSLDIFRNYEKIDQIKAPVAILHGTADTVVPLGNGQALHAQLQKPYEPLWIEGRGHNDMPYGECFHYIRRFLDSLKPN